jgi:hypothetical protein
MKLLLKKSQIPPHLLKFFRKADGPPTHKAKDLVNTPCYLAESLRCDGWYLRSEIQLTKLSPMPESCRDRPTRATEKLYLFAKRGRYYYDQEAERMPHTAAPQRRSVDGMGRIREHGVPGQSPHGGGTGTSDVPTHYGHPAGRNLWDYWDDTDDDDLPPAVWPWRPEPAQGRGHYAVYPLWLPLRCLRLSTSAQGCCASCGGPWRRVTSEPPNVHPGDSGRTDAQGAVQRGYRHDGKAVGTVMRERHEAGRTRETLGWSPSCPCPPSPPVPCRALDPFAGTGTTGVAARLLGRHFTGIELSGDYAARARERLASACPLDDAAWRATAAAPTHEQPTLFGDDQS